MQTTILRVRVSSPRGLPVPGASVRASLQAVGVSLTDGYLDRTEVAVITGKDGVAELVLWPSATGTTDTEYRIIARGADGRRLLDESVSVPESDVAVWLHDIVMLPAPAPKPYDEASIDAIQQNRILAQDARQAAQAAESGASDDRVAALAAATEALSAKANADTSAQESAAHKDQSELRALEAAGWATTSIVAADRAQIHEGLAESSRLEAVSAVNQALEMYGSATALSNAEMAAAQSAANAKGDREGAELSAAQAQNSSLAAESSAQSAGLSRGQASASADLAQQASVSVENDRDAVAQDRQQVETLSGQVEQYRTDALVARDQSVSAATTSQDRASDLVSHASNIQQTIDQEIIAGQQLIAEADQARIDAITLYGSLQDIDNAVLATYANRAIADIALTNNLIVLRS